MSVDARAWVQAENETEFARSRIQGFFYPTDKGANAGQREIEARPGNLVVRDFTGLEAGQELWRHAVEEGGYEEGAALMQDQMRLFEIERIAKRYAQIVTEGKL